MGVTVNINYRTIEARISRAIEAGMPVLAEQILKDCNYYCKLDQGTLIASSHSASDLEAGQLIWNTKYAKKQYFHPKAYRNENPHASPAWCDKAKRTKLDQWEQQANAIMRMELGRHV